MKALKNNFSLAKMPQLDKVTFFSQVTWAFLAYFAIYYLLSVHVCPAIGRTLKIRQKLDLSKTGKTSASPYSHTEPSAFGDSLRAVSSVLDVFGTTTKLKAKSNLKAVKLL